ncbi:MAG TPA: hypothetical protein VNX67_10600, partial [Solirubrobacteraceae bacterium]|nr:hypothetical protein [Solirubrobacteraceae bacterium]
MGDPTSRAFAQPGPGERGDRERGGGDHKGREPENGQVPVPVASPAGDPLEIAGRMLGSRLLLGTGGFPSLALLAEAIR